MHNHRFPTWASLTRDALVALGGHARLRALYGRLAETPRAQSGENAHWEAAVRRTVQLHRDFVRLGPGTWGLADRLPRDAEAPSIPDAPAA